MVRKQQSLRHVLLAGSALALMVGEPALAQQAGTTEPEAAALDNTAPDDAVPDQGDIVVTAQKRSERLQDVPLSVTAVTDAQLSARQIGDTSSLTKAIPSLTFQQGANPTNTSLRVRGIGTSLFGLGVEPSVSLVVDGVVSARNAQNFADFADIERIEVLRGPQGTLFGKNATAGVISIVTKRPSRDLEGNVEATVAEHNEYRIKGSVSGPLGETLRARLSGYYNNVEGHYFNVTTNKPVGGNEGYGVRGKLEWDATDRLNLLATADYRYSYATCCQKAPVQIRNPIAAQLFAPIVASFENRQVADDRQTFAKTNQQTYSLEANLDLGAARVTSITAFQHFFLDSTADNDGLNTAVPIYPGGSTGNAFADNWNSGQVELDNITQELRIASAGKNDFNYVFGVYYSTVDLHRGFQRRRGYCSAGTIGQPCAPARLTFQSNVLDSYLDSSNLAGFGQVDWRIAGGLKLLGGMRIQRESVSVRGIRYPDPLVPGDVLFPGSTPVDGTRSASDTAITGKAGVQYEFSRNAQVYASYTRGYKGLGFNTEAAADFANQNPVLPENVDAYEIGFKGRTVDGTLSVAAALFRADYTNLQVQANRSDPAAGIVQFVQTNAGSSRTEGFEIEATLRPSDAFSVNAAVTYAKATIDIDGLNCPLQYQAAAPVLTGNFPVNSCYRSRLPNSSGVLVTSGPIQDVRGGALPASPRMRIFVSPRYEHAFGNLLAFAQADVQFQSEQQFAVEQDPQLVQPAYTLVDASIGFRHIDRRYSLTLFVKNLFNVNYATQISSGGLLSSPASPFDLYANFNKDSRRYFGANLGFRF